MSPFFAYLSRLKLIQRWGLMRPLVTENVQEHTFEVAVVAHALALIGNRYYQRLHDPAGVALVALFHDASEVLVGDLPAPVKYANPQIREAYKALESEANKRLLGMLPQELQTDYAALLTPSDPEVQRLVKVADKLCGYLKAAREVQGGNGEFRAAEVALKAQVEQEMLPEAKHFLEHFAPSFFLSLDELQESHDERAGEG